MTEDGRRGRASGSSPRRPGRGSIPNEGGLRKLGDQVASQQGPLDPTGPAGPAGRNSGEDADRGAAIANEAGLAALAEAMHGAKRGRRGGRRPKKVRSRRRRIARRVALISLAVVLVVLGGGAGYAYYETHDLHRVQVQGLNSALTTGQEAGTENILMVGSTSRCALTVQNAAYGLCSQGVNGVNSDVIMILHADPAHHQLALLSIPRDLFIPNARSTGPNKIDAGLYQGLSQLVAAIEEDFGIPIQHAVSLNFDQFANIVDALGGINMSFPESVFDAESGLNVQAAACVHLNGTQALQVVRARHLQYDAPGTTTSDAEYWPQEAQSDLARINRDHEFLRVLAAAVAKQGLGNPISDLDLINSVKADLTFDQSWSVSNMASLVLDFHSVDINSVPQLTLPVAVVTDPDGSGGSLVYQGGSYGDVEFPSQAQDQSVIDQVLGIASTTDSMTGSALPAPSAVTVSVMNGTGVANQATDTSDALTALGFHTVGVGDTPAVGDVAETVVYYGSRSAATEAAAESVTRSLSGSVIMAYDPSQVADGAEVTVVTGTQFGVNAPATSTTPTSAGTTPTSTPPSTSTSSAAIAAPSASNPTLAPWDPRACAAGATPTAPVPNRT
jgi:polyisoprenyl-teichoic acid--peptidoglycan teichoic acid transferase